MNSQEVLDWFPQLRGRELSVSPLSGGLTNRNFQVRADEESYVLRLAGADTARLGIDRVRELKCSRAAAELEVGPEVVACLVDQGVLLRRFLEGRVLTPEALQDSEVLGRVIAALRRYHQQAPLTGSFSPFTTVRTYHALARERGVPLPELVREALRLSQGIEEEIGSDSTPCACHNDLLAANFIDDGRRVRIIDWEYAGAGSVFFDLGNLAANNEFSPEQERCLLEIYFGSVTPIDLRRLRLMRIISDLREAMWGFLQSATSNLDFDFLAYGRKHLDRLVQNARLDGIQPNSSSL